MSRLIALIEAIDGLLTRHGWKPLILVLLLLGLIIALI